jgi:hypothetical protein
VEFTRSTTLADAALRHLFYPSRFRSASVTLSSRFNSDRRA